MSENTAPDKDSAGLSASRGFYLGGLDGLRALACCAVLLYHTLPDFVPGGFLGVDVFFVLSGFLITAILLRETELKGRIDIPGFWLRRWRRLFPAVFTVVFVTVPVAAAANLDLLAKLRTQVFGAFTFSYNWFAIYTGDSYFTQALPRFFTNMWTLSVEQQFYLIWPLLTVLIWRLPPRLRIFVPASLALLSMVLMAVYADGAQDFTRAYMGTDCHAFGLMIGAAAAVFSRKALDPLPSAGRCVCPKPAGVTAFAGLFLLFAAFAKADGNSWVVYPWVTVAVCVFTAVICMVMTAPYQRFSVSRAIRTVLDIRVLRWVGIRSYGIYLWHWPLLVIWWEIAPRAAAWTALPAVGGLSFVCAALSYRFVENPMRRRGIFPVLWIWCENLAQICKGVEKE